MAVAGVRSSCEAVPRNTVFRPSSSRSRLERLLLARVERRVDHRGRDELAERPQRLELARRRGPGRPPPGAAPRCDRPAAARGAASPRPSSCSGGWSTGLTEASGSTPEAEQLGLPAAAGAGGQRDAGQLEVVRELHRHRRQHLGQLERLLHERRDVADQANLGGAGVGLALGALAPPADGDESDAGDDGQGDRRHGDGDRRRGDRRRRRVVGLDDERAVGDVARPAAPAPSARAPASDVAASRTVDDHALGRVLERQRVHVDDGDHPPGEAVAPIRRGHGRPGVRARAVHRREDERRVLARLQVDRGGELRRARVARTIEHRGERRGPARSSGDRGGGPNTAGSSPSTARTRRRSHPARSTVDRRAATPGPDDGRRPRPTRDAPQTDARGRRRPRWRPRRPPPRRRGPGERHVDVDSSADRPRRSAPGSRGRRAIATSDVAAAERPTSSLARHATPLLD